MSDEEKVRLKVILEQLRKLKQLEDDDDYICLERKIEDKLFT